MVQDINRKREYQRDWIRAKRERQKEAKEQRIRLFSMSYRMHANGSHLWIMTVIISDSHGNLRDTIEDIRTDTAQSERQSKGASFLSWLQWF